MPTAERVTEESGFWRAIDAAPGDLRPVGVFADWLDECGDERAACLRWCFETGHKPCPSFSAVGHMPTWDWWHIPRSDGPEYLPPELFGTLAEGCDIFASCREYRSASHAYRDLCESWRSLTNCGIDPTE